MKLLKYKGPLFLLITSFFWGVTFLFQTIASDFIGPYLFNATRFLIASFMLILIMCIIKFIKKDSFSNLFLHKDVIIKDKRTILSIAIYAVLIGVSLFFGSNMQQLAITFTKSPAKCSFITSIYIIIVPILSLLYKEKISIFIVILLFISLIGSYLITMNESFSISVYDVFSLISAFGFAFQILFISRIAKYVNVLLLSCVEFFTCGVLSLIISLILEQFNPSLLQKAIPSVLIIVIFGCLLAFVLQMEGQKYTSASLSSLILCLESVFATITGYIFLHDVLSARANIGCLIIFCCVVLSQIDFKKLRKKENLNG